MKDLSVNMSDDTSLKNKIARVAAKCRELAGWILVRETMFVLWKTFILSRLYYCSQMWSAKNLSLAEDIGVIKRCFTTKISSLKNISYWERLKQLELYSILYMKVLLSWLRTAFDCYFWSDWTFNHTCLCIFNTPQIICIYI